MRLGALGLAFVLLVATKASALKQPTTKEEISEPPPKNNEPGCEYDPNLGGTICPKSR